MCWGRGCGCRPANLVCSDRGALVPGVRQRVAAPFAPAVVRGADPAPADETRADPVPRLRLARLAPHPGADVSGLRGTRGPARAHPARARTARTLQTAKETT